MYPTLYQVDGGPGIHTYGLLVLLAFIGGTLWVHVRSGDVGLPTERLPIAYAVAAIGGLLGAKLLYALGVWDASALLSLSGGLAWYGGLLGGAVAVIATTRWIGVDGWKLADVTAPAIALSAGIGRLGCFFAGCCHGAPVARPTPATPLLPEGLLHGQVQVHPHAPFLSNTFEGGAARILDVPLYPTQLWQASGSLALFAGLAWLSRNRRFDGQVVGWFLVLEPLLRFTVELFRGDHRGYAISWPAEATPWWPGVGAAGADVDAALAGLTTSQALGLGMVVLGVVLLVTRRGRGVADETPRDAEWVDPLLAD